MLELQNISMGYPDGTQVLKNINLTISDGEKMALVGANGAGKTTLFLGLVGIQPLLSGEILLDHKVVAKADWPAVRAQIGLVFQNTENQLFMPTVWEDIAFGLRNYGCSEEVVDQKVQKVLEQLSASNLVDKMTHKLSGGEKHLAALASVLVLQPTTLLLDEPSSFLDPRSRKNLIRLLIERTETQIIATHDLDLALDVCTRVVILKDQKIYADGPVRELLYQEELLKECGLELPLSVAAANDF